MCLSGVIVTPEQFAQQTARNGRRYYSFWVRLMFGPHFISVSGWKYYPEDGRISTPSQAKGDGKNWINTTKTNPELYNHIQEEAGKLFGPGGTNETQQNTSA